MKLVYLALVILFFATAFSCCSKSITTYEAANGKAKCGRFIK